MSNYYLPGETANLVDASLQHCQNLGLILDKYPTQFAIQRSERKSDWLKEIKPGSHINAELAKHAYQRWLNAVKAMHTTRFDARTDWRMVVGLGGETVLETDLSLHHVYGIPFIPGSALKGLTRAYVTGEIEGHKSKEIDKDDADIQRIFGTQKDAGSVIFFDAMPLDGQCSIELDIMNSHYPDYYGKGDMPTNDQNPNPVTFLTVTNTTFTFALALRQSLSEKDTVEKDTGKSHLELVQEWLLKALRDYGVGGKTSAGYGSLTVPNQPPTANSQPVQQQQVATKPTSTTPAAQDNPELNIVAGYIRELNSLGNKDIPGRIQGYYSRWQKLATNEAKATFAKAIVERARQAVKERDLANRGWYKELREFLEKAN